MSCIFLVWRQLLGKMSAMHPFPSDSRNRANFWASVAGGKDVERINALYLQCKLMRHQEA